MEIAKQKPYSWTESFKRLLECMDITSNALINKALRFTKPVIVTNSCLGWVDFTCRLYMPETWKTLNENHIKIFSAREMFHREHPNRDIEWKKLAFLHLTRKISRHISLNLIVIGDSSAEHEAGKHLKNHFQRCHLKSIKLQLADAKKMLRHLSIITSQFEKIFNQEDDTKITFC